MFTRTYTLFPYTTRFRSGRELARHPDFYGTLPLMPDAKELFAAVRHLIPVILTGLPRGAWAAPQKIRWAARHFPGTQILTVMAVDKRNHAQRGDILVDDRSEEHTSELQSLMRISYDV